jgi:hypothetical protein
LKIITKIINELGTFESEEIEVTDEQYQLMVESSKEFWCNGPSFYFWTKKGIIIFPAEVASKSILIIEQID